MLKHTMRIADRNGDTTVSWETTNQEQVAAAQQQFEALVKQGFTAYAFKNAGEAGEVTKTFNPEVERILVMPQVVGG